MAMPLRQSIKVATYLAEQKIRRRDKFPLIVELEPLFACNLKCEGCGKDPAPGRSAEAAHAGRAGRGGGARIGKRRWSPSPAASLMHPQIDEIVRQLVAKRKYVFLCTNALLMRKKMDKFKPSPYFAFAVHIDGLRERHDESVAKEGVFDEAVEAIKEAKRRGFRVTTNSTFFNTDTPQTIVEVLNFLNDDLKVDEMMISPAYAYEKAPTRSTSWAWSRPASCSRGLLGRQPGRWRLNHSPLFLDFLEGKVDFPCTAWAIPNYSPLRLAAPLLPDERRVRPDVPGADRGHRLGQVRSRQGPALRQLHGALRLRAHRRPGHDGLPSRSPLRAMRETVSSNRD